MYVHDGVVMAGVQAEDREPNPVELGLRARAAAAQPSRAGPVPVVPRWSCACMIYGLVEGFRAER
jgi:hypothetical protein